MAQVNGLRSLRPSMSANWASRLHSTGDRASDPWPVVRPTWARRHPSDSSAPPPEGDLLGLDLDHGALVAEAPAPHREEVDGQSAAAPAPVRQAEPRQQPTGESVGGMGILSRRRQRKHSRLEAVHEDQLSTCSTSSSGSGMQRATLADDGCSSLAEEVQGQGQAQSWPQQAPQRGLQHSLTAPASSLVSAWEVLDPAPHQADAVHTPGLVKRVSSPSPTLQQAALHGPSGSQDSWGSFVE